MNSDFNFGFNRTDYRTHDPPTYACMGKVVCTSCGKFHGYCSEIAAQINPGENNVDLSKQVSSKKDKTKFENRDWITTDDLPKKGSSKWKIDGARDAKKNKTGILIFVDLTRGKIKRVMSLRKGFTLDAFVDACGSNSDRWKGKTIDLEIGGSEGQYINVSQ